MKDKDMTHTATRFDKMRIPLPTDTRWGKIADMLYNDLIPVEVVKKQFTDLTDTEITAIRYKWGKARGEHFSKYILPNYFTPEPEPDNDEHLITDTTSFKELYQWAEDVETVGCRVTPWGAIRG